MPTAKPRRFLVRNLDAWPYLEIFLVSAVVAVLGIRMFLELSGYPRLGHGRLHIAHMLWGGFLMFFSIAKTVTGNFTDSPGPTTLGRVARTINGFLTGVVFSVQP